MVKVLKVCVVFISVISLAGCATFVSGQNQTIPITTNPSGATVTINGASKVTPTTFVLAKNQNTYFVKIEKEGYDTVEVDLVRGMSGWFWCNILFGGWMIVGMPVDLWTNSAYKFTPMKIDKTLSPIQASTQPSRK